MKAGLHRVRKTLADGTVRWYVFAWRGKGAPLIHQCDGTAPDFTADLLAKAAAARKREFAEPSDSIAALIRAFRQDDVFRVKIGAGTRREYDRHLHSIETKFGKASIGAFEDKRMRGAIIKWRDTAADTPRTADMRITVLSLLLKWAGDRGMLASNMAAGIATIHRADRADIIWQDADWEKLTAAKTQVVKTKCGKAAGGVPVASPQLLNALRLDACTGLRLGDLLSLQWEEIGERAIVKVTSKRGRRVAIPIFDEVRAILDAIQPDAAKRTGPVLCNSRDAAWTTDGFGTVFQRAKKAAGLTVRIHDLRGTYATFLARKGLTDDEIGRIMGWSPSAVADLRRRYIDENHVISSLIDRLNARAAVN